MSNWTPFSVALGLLITAAIVGGLFGLVWLNERHVAWIKRRTDELIEEMRHKGK